jgi:hypothetical protein
MWIQLLLKNTGVLKKIIYFEESIDYDALQIVSDGIRYKDIKAKHIIFAEGFGMHANPYFKNLP